MLDLINGLDQWNYDIEEAHYRFYATIVALVIDTFPSLVFYLAEVSSGNNSNRIVSGLFIALLNQRQWRLPLPQVESGRHTIRSHGASLAKDYRHDWLVLLFLIVMEIVLFVIHPFYRFVGKDMMTDLKYPLKDNTVPIWAVPMYAVLLPIAIFLLVYIHRRDVYDLHHGILGLLYSVLITAVLTDAIKNATGRPRPDFFWRCFPDGVEAYDKLGGVICNGKASVIKEGHKSFPSGHTSWSFAGLGFLSLYLSGKIKAFDRKGHIAKLCIVFLPLLVASLVAVSRVDDYWHHWQDVFAGGLLGLIVATFCYHQFFPPPYDDQGWGPYAYFHAIESSQANSTTLCPVNALSVQVMEAQAVNRQMIGYYGETLVGHEPS